ncbi:hypothetical protein ACWPKO_04060 [Coraliomargarita sp. W4R53]
MQIALEFALERASAEKIANGADPNDIVGSGLEAVQNAANQLADALQVGLDDIEHGRTTTFDSDDALKTHVESIGQKAKEQLR